jgi:phospholipase/carboxylesterase
LPARPINPATPSVPPASPRRGRRRQTRNASPSVAGAKIRIASKPSACASCQDKGIPGLDRFPHRLRPARGEPAGALVLFHGRGTDEHDLFPLFDLLDPEARLVGLTPRGPLTLPPGGSHWYVVRRVGYPDPETFFASYEALGEWLEALPEALGVDQSRVALGGFSQGAVMSYALSLGAGRPAPAALIALSGFISIVEGFELDLEGHVRLPVAIGHGTLDPIIPVEFGRDAARRLDEAGYDVTYRESPMAHTVDPAFLDELRPWLAEAVG